VLSHVPSRFTVVRALPLGRPCRAALDWCNPPERSRYVVSGPRATHFSVRLTTLCGQAPTVTERGDTQGSAFYILAVVIGCIAVCVAAIGTSVEAAP
jgi:hypothetical protein